MNKSYLIIVFISLSAAGAHFDPPDLRLEFELHRQYLRSLNLSNKVARSYGDKMTESYRIQKGDNLWSLSQMLYGDGHFWPRVWSQNQDISNPHLIRAGHTLQLLMGSEDDTPAFRFSEEDEDGGLELAASNTAAGVIEIPPPEIRPKPVLSLPSSFPQWQSVYRQPEDAVIDDRGLDFRWMNAPAKIFLSAYVQENPLNAIGSYEETDSEYGLPVVNRYVFLKIRRGMATPGQKVLLVQDNGLIERINSQWEPDKKLEIHHIRISAEAELTERVAAKNIIGGYEVYRALLTKITGLTLKDHSVILGQIEVVDLSHEGTPGSVHAQIIGSERHQKSALYGPGDIVFLSKGRREGLQVGHILDIYSDRTIRNPNTQVPFSTVASGKVKVVRVSDRLATAVVLESRDGLQQGDQVHQASQSSSDDSEMDLDFNADPNDEGGDEGEDFDVDEFE